MAISPQRLTIYLYSAHRAVIFAIAQLSCLNYDRTTKGRFLNSSTQCHKNVPMRSGKKGCFGSNSNRAITTACALVHRKITIKVAAKSRYASF